LIVTAVFSVIVTDKGSVPEITGHVDLKYAAARHHLLKLGPYAV